jgi:hypothetical protein
MMKAKYGLAAAMITVGVALGIGATAVAHGPGGYGGPQGPWMMPGHDSGSPADGGGPGMMGHQMGPYHHMAPYHYMGPYHYMAPYRYMAPHRHMGPYYGMGPGFHHMGPGTMQGPGAGMLGPDPGMLGPGPGTKGHGMMMGPGMMGPGMMGPGMMGRGMGAALPQDLSSDQVRHMLTHHLAWRGKSGLKLGKVEEVDDDTITAEILGPDGTVVDKLEVDRHTGATHPAQ